MNTEGSCTSILIEEPLDFLIAGHVAARCSFLDDLPLFVGDVIGGRALFDLPNDLAHGSYYGGRKQEDGRIDWTQAAQQVYNLIRAVAPPYPGAFTDLEGHRFIIARARLAQPGALRSDLPPGLHVSDNAVFAICGDGRSIAIHELRHLHDGSETVAGRNILIGELALVVSMARPATATAIERSSVLRISRSLFQRVLESHPEAARRLRDDFAARSNAAANAMSRISANLRS